MSFLRIKRMIKWLLPISLWSLCRFIRSPKGIHDLKLFFLTKFPGVSLRQKLSIIERLYLITDTIPCKHTQHEIMSFIIAILSVPKQIEGCIVEAGCYKGGSTAKFSIAAKLANRRLVVFDSFEGVPNNEESHGKDIFGKKAGFSKGSWLGTLDEVKKNVSGFGEIKACEFQKGWFDDTMPNFSEPVVAIYLDVDLASSTRTCLKYLYPLLVHDGILYSQDGHLPLVINIFNDDEFWKKEVGCSKPYIDGLGKRKLIKIVKDFK